MGKNSQGFVYIFTNPSFKDDWVKIGKTERTVEDRVKELDTTAVPLPFEIYASLQTSKWNEAEKSVHNLLKKDRIRNTREFFNIEPDKALDIFRIVVDLLDDAVIRIYADGNVSATTYYGSDESNNSASPNNEEKEHSSKRKERKKKNPVPSDKEEHDNRHIFCVKGTDRYANASGYYDEKTCSFTVLKGSVIAMDVTPTFSSNKARNEVLKICYKISNGYCLKEDYTFESHSTAASVVLGRSENGNRVWKDADGKKLIDVYPKK